MSSVESEAVQLNEIDVSAARRRVLGIAPFTYVRILAPTITFLTLLLVWQLGVHLRDIPAYVLPAPTDIGNALKKDWPLLSSSLLVTLKIASMALVTAVLLGVITAFLLAQSLWIELSVFPLAVILQVTPMVAVAPLIIIWMDNADAALLVCASIIAFFPILSNTTLGLKSIDPNLYDLFRLYRANRWQMLLRLRIPSALPYFLGGLRISSGLALIGSVVGEFVAGAGGRATGLAYRILEAGYQLEIPRMFAALVMISGTGVIFFSLVSLLSYALLRNWHESATSSTNR